MHHIALILVAACTTTRVVEKPVEKPPVANAAEAYAQTLNASASCIPLSTAIPRQPDAALCDFGQHLAYCRVGVGAGSACKTVIDFPALEQQAQQQAAARAEAERARQAAAASPPPAPVKTPATTEPKKK